MANCEDCGQSLSRFKKNGGHMDSCPQLTGKTRPSGPQTPGENAIAHSHAYGNWGAWICMGDITGEDIRNRTCLDKRCKFPGRTETGHRKCKHGKRPSR